MPIHLISFAFAEGEAIPARYTCDGEDISPPLRWSDTPAGTRSLALIADDPDAPVGTWTHWVAYAIPPTVGEFTAGVPKTRVVAGGIRQGVNDFKRTGYGGPCPPRGDPHRYFFKLYALDRELPLAGGATKQELLNAMKGHILAEGSLMGKYGRK